MTVDVAAVAAWTAANERARRAYHQTPAPPPPPPVLPAAPPAPAVRGLVAFGPARATVAHRLAAPHLTRCGRYAWPVGARPLTRPGPYRVCRKCEAAT